MSDDRPRVGLTLKYENKDGTHQAYRCVALGRRSGATSLTRCSVCNAPFTATSDPTARAVKHRLQGLFATRCDEHRRHDHIKRKPAQHVEHQS